MEACNPSIIKLFDETGESLCSVIERDSEVWETLPVLLIPRWAFAEAVIIVVHLLLEGCNVSLESLDLLPVDIVSDPNGSGESSNDGPELVRGRIGCGSEDVLHRGGREGESPRVSGGESDSHTFFSDIADLEGVVWAKTEVSWEVVSGLFRG